MIDANSFVRDHFHASNNRDSCRRPFERDLWIIDGPSQLIVRCKTDNVSETGLHATAPIGAGLAVGKRFETHLAPENWRGGSPGVAPSLGYATVVRTDLPNAQPGRVGFALHFDSPQRLAS